MEKETYGEVIIGAGTAYPEKLEIAEYFQMELTGGRTVSVLGIIDESIVLTMENDPAKSDRTQMNSMRLCKESLLALNVAITTYIAEKYGATIEDVLKQLGDSTLQYSVSTNFKFGNDETEKD